MHLSLDFDALEPGELQLMPKRSNHFRRPRVLDTSGQSSCKGSGGGGKGEDNGESGGLPLSNEICFLLPGAGEHW